MSVKIKLHVKEHCIECAAKRELNELMHECFSQSSVSKDIEEKIELIRRFLTESDFPKLRGSDERLSGLIESSVCIYMDENDQLKIEITGLKRQ
ncbi:MAG: hypothetical protein MUC95_08830 [Spirochaetes bacterium]|nr:hypothetical protein [Spirochaetota bacterium]